MQENMVYLSVIAEAISPQTVDVKKVRGSQQPKAWRGPWQKTTSTCAPRHGQAKISEAHQGEESDRRRCLFLFPRVCMRPPSERQWQRAGLNPYMLEDGKHP